MRCGCECGNDVGSVNGRNEYPSLLVAFLSSRFPNTTPAAPMNFSPCKLPLPPPPPTNPPQTSRRPTCRPRTRPRSPPSPSPRRNGRGSHGIPRPTTPTRTSPAAPSPTPPPSPTPIHTPTQTPTHTPRTTGRMRGRAASDGVSMPWPPPPTSAGPSLVSILLDAPMLMPPALFFLILETRNDYVRFHGKCPPPPVCTL